MQIYQVSGLLLVEDNELNAEIAEFILTENGAKVETVKNGLEAVQHFEACESGTYDVIFNGCHDAGDGWAYCHKKQ